MMSMEQIQLGSGNITRKFSLEDNMWSTEKITGYESNGMKKEISIDKKSAEFVIIVEDNGKIIKLTNREFSIVSYNYESKSSIIVNLKLKSTSHLNLEIKITYSLSNKFDVMTKQMEIINTHNTEVVILELAVEFLNFEDIFERGGIGQPLFSPGFFWAMEWPVAENQYSGKNISLWQFPDEKLSPGNHFNSEICVIGSSQIGNEVSAFKKYWDLRTIRKKNTILKIYSDWSAHDELSGNECISGKTVLNFLDILGEWKKKGFDLEYYAQDALWYENSREAPYSEFRKKIWPNGSDVFLKKLDEYGFKLGLWLDVSGYNPLGSRYPGILDDAFEQIYRLGGIERKLADNSFMRKFLRLFLRVFGHKKGNVPCLLEGNYFNKTEEAFQYLTRERNLGLIKLDFSNFRCNNPHHSHKPGKYALERSIRRLQTLINNLRKINPEMVIIAYNGFSTHLGFIEQPTTPEMVRENVISPFWLSWIDTLYTGDPRISEVPTPTERSSIACYSDTQFKLWKENLLPNRCIDDHSVLIGNTTTILKIGKKDWTDAWIIGNVGRGHLNFFVYGDLSMINTPDDYKFLTTAYKLVADNIEACGNPNYIGGKPDKGDIYGSLISPESVENDISYVVLHNPSFISRYFKISAENYDNIFKLYPKNTLEVSAEVKLAPAEVAIYQLGGDKPLYQFDVENRFVDGFEANIVNEDYIRKGDKRIFEGEIFIPSIETSEKQLNKQLNISISLLQSIYPWRIFSNLKKQLKFKVTCDNKEVKFIVMPNSDPIMGLSSWANYSLDINQSFNGKIIRFSIEYPFDRLVHTEIKAYILTKGERK